MSDALAIALAWGSVIGVFGLYLVSILQRTKAAAKLVPADRLRWMTSETPGSNTDSAS